MGKERTEKWIRNYLIVINILFIFVFLLSINYFPKELNYKALLVYSIILGISIIIADIYPIIYFPERENQAEITISLALTFTMAFVLPPIYAILTKAIANTIDELITKKGKFWKEWHKVAFNTIYLSIVVGITSITFHLLYSFNLPFLSFHNVIALLISGITYFLIETIMLFILLSHLNQEPFLKFWIKNIKAAQLELLTLFPLGYLLIYIYTKNFWVSILLIPLFIAIYLASQEKVQIINQTENTLYALAKLEDDKFPDTMAHSVRVGNLTERLCQKIGREGKEKEIIVKAANLHDIGKIAIPDAIINKPSKLSESEFAKIKEHPISGANLVSHLVSFSEGADYIRYHHERWDGQGYPVGLKGENIPVGARIISIVDSFDAMISNRPYKKAKTIREALQEIERERGKQFDPEIAKAFIQVVKELLDDDKVIKDKKEFEKYFPRDSKIN